VKTLLVFHVLVAMIVVGALTAAAVAALSKLWESARRCTLLAVATTIVAVALGEGLAADEHAGGGWLDASRGLTVFGLLLGGAGLVALTAPAALFLVLVGLATAFVMAAKPA